MKPATANPRIIAMMDHNNTELMRVPPQQRTSIADASDVSARGAY
jgi:hypothetical protein